MKKVIAIAVFAAFFAACSSSDNSATEAGAKVTSLKNMVDSLKGVVEAATEADEAQLSTWDSQIQEAMSGIDTEKLDEASKTIMSELNDSWNGIKDSYNAKIEAAKQKAMEAQQMANDSTSNTMEDGKTMIEEG